MNNVTKQSIVDEKEKQNDKSEKLKQWEKALLDDSLRCLSLPGICRREDKA
ncbi:hypothetical protein [Bacillus sp. REN10]|uniref:hypothetical protein n=1 Tax=Bacillus sp. REN10 TaxID=2782541 RepID=UPI00193C4DA6|nr:hypothetical protein [Bacillus sp. REN10]